MKQWRGVRDDITDVGGQHALIAQNVSFSVAGELRRRPGLTYLDSVGGTSLGTFYSDASDHWLLVHDSSGNIQAVGL